MTAESIYQKTYFITTFGCQMNAHDSEKLAGILNGMGYRPAEDEHAADLVVYNTCCIRENAENRVLGNLGYLKHIKKKHPNKLVAVGGCMPQQDGAAKRLAATGAVDILFGTFNLHRFGELLERRVVTGETVSEVWEKPNGLDDGYMNAFRENPYRSGVNIMYGCDNFCSYCVVPKVRGRERSRRPEDIIAEIETLVSGGVKDITLLGQNVNSYGQKPEPTGVDFPSLLNLVARLEPAPKRLRFMTSHPKDLSPALIRTIAENDNVCKHIHLPVQSGSSRVLELMNRKYTREGYMSLITALREAIPGIAITTDIIIGFPGETEEDFADTLRLVREARFNGAFTFLYSKRSGTKAAEMPGQVPKDIANERFQRLLDAVNPIVLERGKEQENRTLHVLAEKEEDGVFTGRADNNALVHFKCGGQESPLGKIVPVKITQAKTFFLLGEGEAAQ